MASNSQHNSASSRQSNLPFEPVKRDKKSRSTASLSPNSSSSVETRANIPEVVSRRMAQRMVLFCGVPTLMGLLTFPSSYFIISHGWLHLPHVAVVLTSVGLFGLGALGLSYGVLSASWDENESGSQLGWQEFRVNFGRLTQEWRSQNQQKKS